MTRDEKIKYEASILPPPYHGQSFINGARFADENCNDIILALNDKMHILIKQKDFAIKALNDVCDFRVGLMPDYQSPETRIACAALEEMKGNKNDN